MGFHIGRIRISVNGIGISLSVPNLVAQFKELLHGLPGAGDILLHFVDERFHAKGHFTVIFLVRGDQMICFRNANPVHLVLHPQFPEQGADISRGFRRAKVIQLMQTGFKLKPPSFEAGGKSAGQVVLFQEQAGKATLKYTNCGCQPSVTGTNDNHVVLSCTFVFHGNLLVV